MGFSRVTTLSAEPHTTRFHIHSMTICSAFKKRKCAVRKGTGSRDSSFARPRLRCYLYFEQYVLGAEHAGPLGQVPLGETRCALWSSPGAAETRAQRITIRGPGCQGCREENGAVGAAGQLIRRTTRKAPGRGRAGARVKEPKALHRDVVGSRYVVMLHAEGTAGQRHSPEHLHPAFARRIQTKPTLVIARGNSSGGRGGTKDEQGLRHCRTKSQGREGSTRNPSVPFLHPSGTIRRRWHLEVISGSFLREYLTVCSRPWPILPPSLSCTASFPSPCSSQQTLTAARDSVCVPKIVL